MPSETSRMLTIKAIKYYLYLFVFATMSLMVLLGVNKILSSPFPIKNILLLSGGYTLIALTALVIFFFGFNKDVERSVFLTIVAIGVKMVLSLVLALLFLVVFKNRDTGSVVLFFVLYLGFTVFVVLTFLSVLKIKSV
jgi:hypothetical protein